MGEVIHSLVVSDWIQIVSILATTTISIISVFIALKSLKLTRKSIEDANKPYISCYVEMIEVGHFQKYFVIKNFGNTPAIIIDITFDKHIKGLGRNGKIDSIKDTMIAPGQKFITSVNIAEKEMFTVHLVYRDMKGLILKQNFLINLGYTSDLMYIKSKRSNLSDDTNEFRNMLHDFVKRTL